MNYNLKTFLEELKTICAFHFRYVFTYFWTFCTTPTIITVQKAVLKYLTARILESVSVLLGAVLRKKLDQAENKTR